jgi:hypothetical protein
MQIYPRNPTIFMHSSMRAKTPSPEVLEAMYQPSMRNGHRQVPMEHTDRESSNSKLIDTYLAALIRYREAIDAHLLRLQMERDIDGT